MAQGHALQRIPPDADNAEGTATDVVRSGPAEEIKNQATVLSPQDAGAGNVDKIRDILFGPQMREYESRFVRLEDDIAKELADLRETAKKRSDSIEGYVRTEFESLQARVRSEREDRGVALRQLARDLSELSTTLTKKIEDVDEQAAQAHRQLRIELVELAKNFTDDLTRKQEEMTALVDKRFQELRRGKTDRATLATLLTEMSLKLSGELAKSGSEL
jgi:uncharacterized protein YukE